MIDLLAAVIAAWVACLIIGLLPGRGRAARLLLILGLVLSLVLVLFGLARGEQPSSAMSLDPLGSGGGFRLTTQALWLFGFGAAGALAAVAARSALTDSGIWYSAIAVTLLGALGVFGVGDAVGFLIAWEIMSLGCAVVLLLEQPRRQGARPVLMMLGLLEVGSVALLAAFLWFAAATGTTAFTAMSGSLSGWRSVAVGLLLLIGFGAKLGLLPFYEWFPAAYLSGSGASGAVLSGIVLNAAFFALTRGLLDWLDGGSATLAYIVLGAGTITAVLSALYAFQQDDWRALLAFSSAENAAIAVTLTGAALLFSSAGMEQWAGLAWTASYLHIAGHSLAKPALFLTADGIYRTEGTYELTQSGIAAGNRLLGVGALLAGMSLAAIPPTPGFISEWFGFQSLFQGFHLGNLEGRIALVLSGAGLALTGAIALATFVKILGLGLLGRSAAVRDQRPPRHAVGIPLLGVLALLFAIGLPWWLTGLNTPVLAHFGKTATTLARHGWLLVPLTPAFAFISPTKLAIAIPLYALAPTILVYALARRRFRRAPVWYGGLSEDAGPTATTALTFSNAMRRYYSFVYRPRTRESREHTGAAYFVHRLTFSYDLAPVFGPYLFDPAVRLVRWSARRLRALQSGYLNFYLSLIGLVLLIILIQVLV